MTQPNTMNLIIKSTAHAREKHPEFAPGITQALCLAQEELGEMAKAINDNAPWAEIESEIYDTIAVLVRIAEKDYLKAEPEFTLFPPDMVRQADDEDFHILPNQLKEELEKFQISGQRLALECKRLMDGK